VETTVVRNKIVYPVGNSDFCDSILKLFPTLEKDPQNRIWWRKP